MTKTTEEITALRDTIQAEIDRLPSHNIFGGSNAKEIEESKKDIQDLNRVLEGKEPLGPGVLSWIEGSDDYLLKDYMG